MKIKSGTRWKKKHTDIYCKILSTIFYNVHIEYEDRIGLPSYDSYWHYKKFLKHWDEVDVE